MDIQQDIIYKKIFIKRDNRQAIVYINVCDLDQMFITNQTLIDSQAYKNAELKIKDNCVIINGTSLLKKEYFPNFWYLKSEVFDIVNGDYGYFDNIEKKKLTIHGFRDFVKFKDHFSVLKESQEQIRFIPFSSQIIFNKMQKI